MATWMLSLSLFVLVAGLPTQQIPGPASPSQWPEWLQSIKVTRNETLTNISYNGSIFDVPKLAWTRTSYIQPQSHPFDRYFYDPAAHSYTIDIFLDDLVKRYGGIDSVLVWPTYPNIGLDDRNQYDLIRSMPGQEAGLRDIVQQMEARGVHVMLPYNPWDTGTRDTGIPDEQSVFDVLNASGARGIFGDTMEFVPQSFYDISEKHGLAFALEPEGGGETPSLNWDTVGWGYWSYPFVPSVDLWKWLEPRHMTHLCDRWGHNRTDALQAAWFNGIGYETWENVWGCWNGMSLQDAEATRRVSHMLRFFGNRGFLQSPLWTPHVPTLQNANVFASEFPLSSGHSIDRLTLNSSIAETVWTFVNRASIRSSGPQLRVAASQGLHYYDCYHGTELSLSPSSSLAFEIEALGYGCVLATSNISSGALAQYLGEMKQMTARPLHNYSKAWHYLQQTMVSSPPTPTLPSPPAGMVAVPGGSFHFVVSGVEIEGNDDEGVDVQYAWESYPHRSHDAVLQMEGFYIDRYPVTNQQYRDYLQQSKYVPRDPYNFLKNWNSGNFPDGWGNKPVTYVSLSEARAYCAFFERRLPQEIEWQYAAQGYGQNLYPWGNDNDPSKYPVEQHGRTLAPGPADVDAFSPGSDSMFGVGDLVGNTWEYTSEFQDDHTRAAVLRGGSYYRPNASSWYFPQAKELNLHGKYLLMDDSYERAGTLGFRCASSAPFCTRPLCMGFGPSRFPRINLTALGDLDWMQFGTQNRKMHGRGLSFVVTGSSSVSTAFPSTFVWNDGVPTVSSSSTAAVLLSSNSSLQITCSAAGSNYEYFSVFFNLLSGRAEARAVLGNESQRLNLSLASSNVSVEIAYLGVSNLSVSIVPLLPCDSGRLCGLWQPQTSDADLTVLGQLDWVHWGLTGPNSEDRKRNRTVLLSDLATSQPAGWFANNPGSSSWSDGIPTLAASYTSTGLYVSGVGSTFKFTAKGTGSFAILRVFCGTWQASAKFTAQFPNGDVYVEHTPLSGGQTSFIFTVNYLLAEGEEMTVSWSMEDGSGNITLEAASVTTGETLVMVGGISLNSQRQDSPTSKLGFRTIIQ